MRCWAYFTMFASFGMSQPFVPLLYSTLVSPSQVGVLVSVGPILSIATGPLSATAADIYDCHRAIMIGSLALGAVLWLPLLLPGLGFAQLLLLALMQALLGGKSGSILDASTVDAVGQRYGNVRLWGAVGFGVCSLVGGALIETAGESAPFRLMLLCSVATGLIAAVSISVVSVEGLRKAGKRETRGKQPQDDGQSGAGLRDLQNSLLTCRVGVFLLIVFLSGVASGLIDTFLYVHLDTLGAGGTLMGALNHLYDCCPDHSERWLVHDCVAGLARFITCAAEVPAFRMADSLLDRFGVLGVLAMAQVAYVCRMLWYATLTPATVIYVLPCEILHGLTFAALWSACCYNAAALAPEGLKASMQGVVGGVHWGLGVGTGATVGGILFAQVGGTRMFLAGSLVSTTATAISLAAYRSYPMSSKPAGGSDASRSQNDVAKAPEEDETDCLLKPP